jgi:hypothetical protein
MTDSGERIAGQTFFRRHRNSLTALLLAIAAWIFYLPTINYGFVYYDDVRILRDHPELYGQSTFAADLKGIFVTYYPREEPLLIRDVSWAVDSRIFGFGNPLGYHLGNVFLHGIVTALTFAFLLGTTRRYHFALTVSAAWLLLAVHVEPVAWIMGRKDILSALFMLLALCAQAKRLTTNNKAAQGIWFVATLACFIAGLLSKISVLTFPLVLFLHAVFFPYLHGERAPNAPFSLGRSLLREGFLFLPAMFASGVIYVWYQRTLAQMGVFDRGYSAHGLAHLWNLFMVNPLGLWLYLRQIFFPWHLAVLYTWPGLQNPYPLWQIAIAFTTVAAIAAMGIWLYLRRKEIFFYYAALFTLMIPYLNLFYIGIWVADRYVYFSSLCVLAIAVSLAGELFRQKQRPLLRLGALTALIILAATNLLQKFSYERAWRDGETLWQYHITLPDPSPGAYVNLAGFYYASFTEAHAQNDSARMVSCIRKMEIVVQAGMDKFWPDHNQPPPQPVAKFLFLKSLTQQVKEELDAARESLLESDRLAPDSDATNLNLARLYRELAANAGTPDQKKSDLSSARDRFKKYIALAFRGRPAAAEIQKEFSEIETECIAAGLPAAK